MSLPPLLPMTKQFHRIFNGIWTTYRRPSNYYDKFLLIKYFPMNLTCDAFSPWFTMFIDVRRNYCKQIQWVGPPSTALLFRAQVFVVDVSRETFSHVSGIKCWGCFTIFMFCLPYYIIQTVTLFISDKQILCQALLDNGWNADQSVCCGLLYMWVCIFNRTRFMSPAHLLSGFSWKELILK